MAFEILPTAYALNSFRSSGYKSAAHAIAELMDNAVDAGASRVELICVERPEYTPLQQRRRVREIGVLDNGCGMDANTLRAALQIGVGAHLEPTNRRSIGRYGMGLPMASISQARRVDVWSWRQGVQSAFHTFLDLYEIEQTGATEVPEPTLSRPPESFINVARNANPTVPQTVGETGTLVVWTDLDRYRGGSSADTLFRHSRELLGRIYRRRIARGDLAIRFVTVNDTHGYDHSEYVAANDPLFLTVDKTFPAPWDEEPVFEPWGRDSEEENFRSVTVRDAKGREHHVILRFAHAKASARQLPSNRNPGTTDYGQRAKKNLGVSLMRCGRELDLDTGLVSNHTIATERWWGVEVEFPPELDDIFGVTNDKQHAVHFSALTKSDLLENVNSREAARRKRAEMYDDERSALFELCYVIKRGISLMRSALTIQTAGARSGGAGVGGTLVPPSPAPETARGTAPQLPDSSEKPNQNVPGKDVRVPPPSRNPVTSRGCHYEFVTARLPSPSAIFAVQKKNGARTIALNTRHPAYHKLLHVFDDDTSDDSADDLRERLTQATDGIKLLLEAWARYEDEQPDGSPRQQAVYQARERWGEMAWEFLKGEDDAPP